ncbi:MAG: helix-turn-helix domain-containing protein [Lachnospiraceae bacterium]|nr:helix-turn-helix domain-containing protein [Lachnospiraceae bacterium]
MDREKERIYHEYVQRERAFVRADYRPEFDFYYAVKDGEVEKVRELCKDVFSDKEGLGVLSKDPLRNLKYHFTITAAMIARYCIEGGMELSDSYGLSDFYIQKADVAVSEAQITDIHNEMSLAYAKKMKNLRKKKITSMPVARALNYIYDHLHARIRLEDLADYVQVNPSYLSRIFKKEMGVSVSEYIRTKKLETAKNMLLYSDFSASEISSILAFCGQSYFTEQFRKQYGLSPADYRRQNLFRSKLTEE